MAKNRNLFISHAWTYGDAYSKLVGMLDAAPRFTYSNYTIPKDDPVHDAANERQLYDAISNKIRFCDVVVIMAGVYSTYSNLCLQRFLQRPTLPLRLRWRPTDYKI